MPSVSLLSVVALTELLAHPVLAVGLCVRLAVAFTVGCLPLGQAVPARVRLALAITLALLALPAAAAAAPLPAASLPLLILSEAVVGLAFGLLTALALAAAAWAGAVVGSVAGLSWAGDFTVGGEADAGGSARLAWWCGVTAFFSTGGHLVVVAGLLDSVRLVPIGVAGLGGGVATPLAQAVTAMPSLALELALAVATPTLAAVLSFHLATAIAVRTLGFLPGQGMLQAGAALLLVVVIAANAPIWLGGFGAAAGRLVGAGLTAAAGR